MSKKNKQLEANLKGYGGISSMMTTGQGTKIIITAATFKDLREAAERINPAIKITREFFRKDRCRKTAIISSKPF